MKICLDIEPDITYSILCFVDRASLFILVNNSN